MKSKVLGLGFLLTLALGCFKGSVNLGVGNDRTLSAHGVTYVVPWETASHHETGTTFEYEGETLKIREQSGQLTVNGRSVGLVKSGDVVSFTNGVVFVNGQRRDAVK